MINETSDQFKRDFNKVLEESGSCPSTEELRRYLDNELPTDDAQRMEFHLFDCPLCTELMYILEEDAGRQLESEPAYRDQRDKEMDRTAAVLGLRAQGQPAPRPGFFSRLWAIRLPAVVPVAVAAVCLALLIPTGPGDKNISFHDIPNLTADLSISRSAEIGEIAFKVEAGKISEITLQLDSAKLGWDDTTPVECHFIDPSRQKEIHQVDVETNSSGIYKITLGIQPAVPGIWTVELVQEGADNPFETFEIEVVAPAPE